jgi:hypothetical protein
VRELAEIDLKVKTRGLVLFCGSRMDLIPLTELMDVPPHVVLEGAALPVGSIRQHGAFFYIKIRGQKGRAAWRYYATAGTEKGKVASKAMRAQARELKKTGKIQTRLRATKPKPRAAVAVASGPPKPQPLPDDRLGAKRAFTDIVKVEKGAKTKELTRAVAVMDSLLVDGTLPTIEMRHDAKPGQHGAYKFFGAQGVPDHVAINPEGDHSGFTALHELGHFLDHQGLLPRTKDGRSVGYASRRSTGAAGTNWKRAAESADTQAMAAGGVSATPAAEIALEPEREEIAKVTQKYIAKVFESLDDSAAVRKLRKRLAKAKADGKAGNERYYTYLTSPEEVWARAYAQYVVHRSGDAELKKQLDKERARKPGIKYNPRQWDDDDFEPVARAMDKLFYKLGWLKEAPGWLKEKLAAQKAAKKTSKMTTS